MKKTLINIAIAVVMSGCSILLWFKVADFDTIAHSVGFIFYIFAMMFATYLLISLHNNWNERIYKLYKMDKTYYLVWDRYPKSYEYCSNNGYKFLEFGKREQCLEDYSLAEGENLIIVE